MRRILMLAVLAVAIVPASLAAQTAQPTAPATVSAAQAMTLAQLMSPRELMLDMELREFDRHFVPSLRGEADLQSLEAEYPGLFEAMHKATRPLVAKGIGRTVDRVHEAMAAIIQDKFTTADVAELIDFYRSPVGQKTVQQMAGAADATELYQQAVKQDDFKLSADTIAQHNRASATKAAKSFTPDEQAQMLLFMAKPSFSKLAEAQPQIQQLLAEKFNASDPDFDREVEQAMSSAIAQHIATFEGKSDGK